MVTKSEKSVKRMRKSWGVFWLVALGGAAAVLLLWRAALWLGAAGTAVFGGVLVWWGLYYRGLHYRLDNKELIIQSGLVFRKEYHIPRVNILWVTRIGLWLGAGRRAALCTVIRTAGGKAVIFADYSTES